MSTYTESKHVRGGDVANSGRYSHKSVGPSDVDLTPMGDDDLASFVTDLDAVRSRVNRDAELAHVAILSRKILKAHPDAEYVLFEIVEDESKYIDELHVFGSDDQFIETYDRETDEGEELLNESRELSPHTDEAHWTDYNVDINGYHESQSVDLKKAASWSPGTR